MLLCTLSTDKVVQEVQREAMYVLKDGEDGVVGSTMFAVAVCI